MEKRFGLDGGVDLSWSRIKAAQLFKNNEIIGKQINLVVGDMFNLPFLDNSIDIVYTRHSLEPNRGKEKELIEELYRITRKWLVLIEPSYEMATEDQRKRMDDNGYIKGLPGIIEKLGYNVMMYEKFQNDQTPVNPAAITIIKKEEVELEEYKVVFADPITRTKMDKYGNAFYSKESMLAYPIINDVPCLLPENAIVTTKLLDYFTA